MGNISFHFPTFSAAFSKVKSVAAPLGAKWFPRRRIKRIGVTVAILVAFCTLFGFFILPLILKSLIASQASKALGRSVSIARVRVNPYTLSVTISGLEVREPDGKDKFLSVGEIYVNAQAASIFRLAPILNEIRVESPYVHIVRLDETRFNFSDLIKPGVPKAEPSKPVRFSLNNIRIRGGDIRYSDKPKGKEYALSAIHVDIPSISNLPDYVETDVQPRFSATFDGSPVALTGATKPFAESRETTLTLALKDLHIPYCLAFAPFNMDYKVLSGTLNVNGTLSYMEFKHRPPEATLRADMSVARVEVVDMAGNPMVKLSRLALDGIMCRPLVSRAFCRKVSINGLDLNVTRDASGKINLMSLVPVLPPATPPPAPAKPWQVTLKEIDVQQYALNFVNEAPAQPAAVSPHNLYLKDSSTAPAPVPPPITPAAPAAVPPPQAISISKMTFKDGKTSFTDKTITPNYSLDITAIEGKVEGFSLKGDTDAIIDIGARLDQAPLRISGRLKPVTSDLFADVHIVFTDMELSPFTPYSDKFIGYPVSKGKLSLDLQYLIDKRKLDAQNKLFTDQLTLGDKVNSPTATNLPVKLALALLTDRHGQIKLDIPVSGSLDDPKFRVLPVVLHVLVNILEKAATSPFALLAALTGGGEELSFVEFDFGKAALSDQAKKALDKLVGALADRPALRFEIRPQIDVAHDTEAVRKSLFDRKLKAQMLKELVAKGQPVVPVDRMTVADKEYERLLTLAYEEEDMPKPRTIIGTLKKQPRAEMERMLNEHIQFTPDDLRALAFRRAAAVREYMLASKSIEPERLFLIEPEVQPSGKTADAKTARIAFNLGTVDSAPSDAEFNAPPDTGDHAVLPQKHSTLRKLLTYGGAGVVGVLIVIGALSL